MCLLACFDSFCVVVLFSCVLDCFVLLFCLVAFCFVLCCVLFVDCCLVLFCSDLCCFVLFVFHALHFSFAFAKPSPFQLLQ